MSSKALQAEIKRQHQEAYEFGALVEALTRGFLRTPYVLSPLGEGVPPDADPRFRLDAFDCTTFVETAIAFSASPDLSNIKKTLDQLRYDEGNKSFDFRRHLVTSHWVPGLVRDGFVSDITEQVGGRTTRIMEIKLDGVRWRKRRVARTLKLKNDRVPNGLFKLPYIPIGSIRQAIRRIPGGTIVNVVRKDVPYAPDVVTHQGIIVVKKKRRYLRHASRTAKRVVDERLVRAISRYQSPRKWPIVGFNLLKIEDKRLSATP